MMGYIEDLELINVSDILNNISLNNSSMHRSSARFLNDSSSSRESQRYARRSDIAPVNAHEYENTEKLNDISAENILSGIPNSVGYLQEMCVKKGLGLPEYGILNQDGPSHNPTFSTFCRVQDHYGVASADTKKKGKEMAARQVIMCIRKSLSVESKNGTDNVPNNETGHNSTSETTFEMPSKNTSASTASTMNYVGFLQELCVRKHLPPPGYGTEKSTGTPNNPSFYIFCEVGSHREVGIASNKKSAKQLAAEKVLSLLEMHESKTQSFAEESTHAENDEYLQTTTTTKPIQILSETALETFTTIPNPVGHLQELCVRNRLTPPVYEIVKVDGPPHCPTFVTSCKVEYFYQEAASSNKKKGKELAASRILKCLMEYRSASK